MLQSSSFPLPRAVLGPTNTGKTFYAMERMLGHPSGMMGFPLRLLARENYERAVEQVGTARVALITGEEKIIPPGAKYFLCTVEAMPLDRRVDFLAIDEVQLAADQERGHVFTDRILHARGIEETLFLGAETIRRVLQTIIPGISIDTRERFSRLSWSGQKKVTRMPQRSAVVAYSIPEVIRLAELIRSQRGGTAIVMGALSPRARNAQVELYQSGAVDYMVATDAIGMGLNMDINHVGLAGDIKFDGRRARRLTPAELAQVAGRAGRHTRDGTFGITETCEPFEQDVIDAIENHRFPFLKGVFYRNSRLDYATPDTLVKSLEAPPPLPVMMRKMDADDHQALISMIERDDIRVQAHGEPQVRLLQDVCQIPDYQREYSDSHIELLARIYTHLVAGEMLPKDWVTASMQRLDRPDGDMDTLMNRLSAIRTWSYISQRNAWLDDAESFQGLARTIEDRVSDSLNQVLTERFVDRRAAVLSRRLKENTVLMSVIKNDGTVLVEGEEVGHLDGFVFTPQISDSDEKGPVLAAARKALGDEISQRARALVASADEAFKPDQQGMIHWREAVIGRLVKGDHLYQPRVDIRGGDLLEGDMLKSVQDRLNAFASSWPKTVLEKAVALTGDGLTGTARGIGYQVYESLGTLPTRQVITMVRDLDEDGKRQLAQHGVRLGVDMIYMADLLKPAQIAAKALLFSLDTGEMPETGPPPAGRVAINHIEGVSDAYWLATGYRRLGSLVMRVDMAERLSAVVRAAAREGQFMISEEMLSLAGATKEQMDAILIDLGYLKADENPAEDPEKPPLIIYTRPEKQRRKPAQRQAQRQAQGEGTDGGAASDGGKRRADHANKSHQNRSHQNRSRPNKSGPRRQGDGKSRPPRPARPQEPRLNPDSPFAVLAQLKAGSSSKNG